MKNCLLFLAVVAAMAVAGPAYSQHVYLDVDGDGLNFDREAVRGNTVGPDALDNTVTAIDVYFVTDENGDGSAAICSSAEPFTINSYEAVLRYTGSGTVTFTGWTDNMGFAFPIITAGDGTFATAGTDTWFGRGSGEGLAPGTYKVGTVSVTVTGTPTVVFGTSSTISGNAQTAFGSSCDGAQFGSTIIMGSGPGQGIDYDFTDNYGTTAPTPTVKSTWGKIKTLYR
jgi:hypothetical protein